MPGKEDKTFRAAAVQLAPVLFDRDGTTEKILKAIIRQKNSLDTIGHYSDRIS